MSARRLDPDGLEGAFARSDAPSALDFLVPPRPEPVSEPAPTIQARPRGEWSPAAPPCSEARSPRRLLTRLGEALLGRLLRRVTGW